ncbi:MAG: putative Ig domain-containing protein [Bacteriovoracia bacterium]
MAFGIDRPCPPIVLVIALAMMQACSLNLVNDVDTRASASALAYPASTFVFEVGNSVSVLPVLSAKAYSIEISPALPAGLHFDPATGMITGTPHSAAAAQNYLISMISEFGAVVRQTISLAVVLPRPSGFSYPEEEMFVLIGESVNLEPEVTGIGLSFSVDPALPSGLSLDPVSGVVSGTATQYTAGKTYTITASNSSGDESWALKLAVYFGARVDIADDLAGASDTACQTAGNAGCSLRAAVRMANAHDTVAGGPTMIVIPENLHIVLGGTVLQLSKSVNILGMGGVLELSGERPTSVVDADFDSRVFKIDGGISVLLQNLTLTKGRASGTANNESTSFGGAIMADGAITSILDLNGVHFVQNFACGTFTEATLTCGTTVGYRGGALYFNSGTLNIRGGVFESNRAQGSAGALLIGTAPSGGAVTVKISQTLFKDNAAVANTLGGGEGGGAIVVLEGKVEIDSSLFSGNLATGNGGSGGAIYAFSTADNVFVRNSTFTTNSAKNNGGAIYTASAPVYVDYSTIYGNNNAAGLTTGSRTLYATGATGRIYVRGTIIAGSAANCAVASSGLIVSNGYNLSDTAATDCSLSAGTDRTSTPSSLSALDDNGGWTATFLPASGSMAIDNGGAACVYMDPANISQNLTLTVDQRGNSRPGGGACDIGAVESNASSGQPFTQTWINGFQVDL